MRMALEWSSGARCFSGHPSNFIMQCLARTLWASTELCRPPFYEASGVIAGKQHHVYCLLPGHFEIMSQEMGVPLVAFRLSKVIGTDGKEHRRLAMAQAL